MSKKHYKQGKKYTGAGCHDCNWRGKPSELTLPDKDGYGLCPHCYSSSVFLTYQLIPRIEHTPDSEEPKALPSKLLGDVDNPMEILCNTGETI